MLTKFRYMILRLKYYRWNEEHTKQKCLSFAHLLERSLTVSHCSYPSRNHTNYDGDLIRLQDLGAPLPTSLEKLRTLISADHNKKHDQDLITQFLLKMQYTIKTTVVWSYMFINFLWRFYYKRLYTLSFINISHCIIYGRRIGNICSIFHYYTSLFTKNLRRRRRCYVTFCHVPYFKVLSNDKYIY